MDLVFSGITFRYRRRADPVFADFSWAVPQGKTVLLGPNGAGKTTLLSLAADALRAQAGSVCVDGLEGRRRRDRGAYRRAVGWMPQQVRAVPGLTVREQVAYAAWLKGASRAQAWQRAAGAIRQVSLGDLQDRLTTQLSGGQLRRVGLAQVLAHDAQVLLLDEPTVGLDPAQRSSFRDLLAALPDARTVLVSTHQVDDLSELFETVAILDHGRLLHVSSVGDFLRLAPGDAVRPAEAAYGRLVSGAA
jgi:ABC-2 type transport system ATP-binding protein